MKEIQITFDGGTSCNIPKIGFGEGYGSYQIDGGEIVRVIHGTPHSCNSAEVMTLVEALRSITNPPCETHLIIRGDSRIALNWASKRRRNPPRKTTDMFAKAVYELQKLTCQYRKITTIWHARHNSVSLFGH